MKKIAVNTVKAFLKENKKEDAYTQAFTVGDSSLRCHSIPALTIAEKSTFLNRVVSGCFDATASSALSMSRLCCELLFSRCVPISRP